MVLVAVEGDVVEAELDRALARDRADVRTLAAADAQAPVTTTIDGFWLGLARRSFQAV